MPPHVPDPTPGAVSYGQAPPVQPASASRRRLGLALEAVPLFTAACWALLLVLCLTIRTPRPAAFVGLSFLLLAPYSVSGTGWIACRRFGSGIAIFVARGVGVFVLFWIGMILLFPEGASVLKAFWTLFAVLTAASTASVVSLFAVERRRAAAWEASPREMRMRTEPASPSAVPLEARTTSARGRRYALLALAAVLGGATVVSFAVCGSGGFGGYSPPPPRRTDITEGAARSFAKFSIYWVGDSFNGAPLDRVIGQYPDEEYDPVLVTYGACGDSFETGCQPALVVKSRGGCLASVDPALKVRGRTANNGAHLEVQAGDAVVTLYGATSQIEEQAAQAMVVMNAGATGSIRGVAPGDDLPGSLCELQRSGPHPTPVPVTREVPTQHSHAATVIASFGEIQNIDDPTQAEQTLGWRVLRSNDPRYTAPVFGALRTFKNTLPRLEQVRYAIVGHGMPLEVAEEPESYPAFDVTPHGHAETLGRWTGTLWENGAQLGFEFYSGETVEGQRIRVSVFGEKGGITVDDVRRFAATLTFSNEHSVQ